MLCALIHFLICEMQPYILLAVQFYTMIVSMSAATVQHKIKGEDTNAAVASAFGTGGACTGTTGMDPKCLMGSVGTSTDSYRSCCELWAANAITTGDKYTCTVKSKEYSFDFTQEEGGVEKKVHSFFLTGLVPLCIAYGICVAYFCLLSFWEGPGPVFVSFDSGLYIYITKKLKHSRLYFIVTMASFVMLFYATIDMLKFVGFFKSGEDGISQELALTFLVQIYFLFTVWYKGIYQKIVKKGAINWNQELFKGLKLNRAPKFGSIKDKDVLPSTDDAEVLSEKAANAKKKLDKATAAWENASRPLDTVLSEEYTKNMKRFEEAQKQMEGLGDQVTDDVMSTVLKFAAPCLTKFGDFIKPIRRLLTQNNDSLLEDLASCHVRAQEFNMKKVCAVMDDQANFEKFGKKVSVPEKKIASLIPGYPYTFNAFSGNYSRGVVTEDQIREKAEKFVEEQTSAISEDGSEWLLELIESFTC